MTLIILQSFCSIKNKKITNSYVSPPPTTLDSLQGIWISTKDSLWQITITGRIMDDFYKNLDSTHKYYRIYFSDTLVDGDTYKFNQVSVDTTAKTGIYMIAVSTKDLTIDCYKFGGIDQSDGITYLDYQATWTDHGPNVFKKQQ